MHAPLAWTVSRCFHICLPRLISRVAVWRLQHLSLPHLIAIAHRLPTKTLLKLAKHRNVHIQTFAFSLLSTEANLSLRRSFSCLHCSTENRSSNASAACGCNCSIVCWSSLHLFRSPSIVPIFTATLKNEWLCKHPLTLELCLLLTLGWQTGLKVFDLALKRVFDALDS